MKYDFALSIIYYICGCFYAFLCAYTVVANAKSKINRLFLVLTSSMAIWSFSYSLSNSASTAEVSAFWRSFSVFGWGVFYSILLHFVLILTKTESRLNKRIMHSMIYLPALINIILFAPLGLVAEQQYEMVQTDFGWVNTIPLDIWGIWFIVYYSVFLLASLILLVRWWKNIEPHTPLKRQATYFLISILVPLILGVATETLPDILGESSLPQLTIIFLMIPMTTLYTASRKFGLLLKRKRLTPVLRGADKLLDDGRLRLFETVTAIFVIGSTLSFLIGYFCLKRPLENELLYAAALLLIGIFIRFLPFITSNHAIQNTIFLIINTLSLFYMMRVNADTGALTIWAVYILFFLYTVVLNSDIHAILFLAAILIIQVVLGIIYPEVSVTVDWNQYILRISLIVLTFIAVRYLTNEYASKIEGYKQFAREQEVLERISSSFISVNIENAKEKTDEMLEMSADILGFNHAYIIKFDDDYEDATILNTCVKNVKSASFPFYPGMKVKTATLPMAQSLITKDATVTYGDYANLAADEADKQDDFFLTRGINSFFALPIEVNKKVIGMIIIEYYDLSDISYSESRLYFLKMMANILGDAKQKTLYESMLYDYAYFDEITKLANANMLIKRLEQTIQDRQGSDKIAVLDIELENLRMINDTFGHNVGEQIMAGSAVILENLLGGCCDISRAGEGEFVVVLPDVEDIEQIEDCAHRLLNAFSNPVSTSIGIEALFVVIRIGISVYPDDGRDALTLLKNANLAGYEARSSGEPIVFYTEQLESHIAENTLFTNKLFKSLENEEFFLEFQPQVSCITEKTVGIEALLRWTSDGNRRVPPDRFIPILEQTGLIYDVGLWVLEQALQEHKRLIAHGFPPLRVSVNLSVVQFEGEDFISDVAKIIEDSGVDPKYLELEITESLFSKDPEDVLKKLYELKELGVSIAIDDFGKGYSSLNRLKVVPFDRIKIDKEIIDYIDLDRKVAPITGIIILLARTFKAEITAEGIETKEQAEFLKSLDCDEIQGYYYSRPLSTEALEEFLKEDN